ncbi:phage tail assembly chaperone [Limoniibacter endophyticus]|uniref:Uncharacterized protein n=1 Tax=Limoniibacter endophyticus TaxID=1565040 RepID=A0A8J3DLF4_9HYPH|nr:hypothetical protein GCM10010136_31850 [Limoniibacter endophyticus]
MPGTYGWLSAFWELSTDRQLSMGVGPIPLASIDNWIGHNDLDEVDGECFKYAVREMDKAYLEYANKPEDQRPTVSSRPLTPELFDAIFG